MSRNRLVAGAAALALVAGGVGILIGRNAARPAGLFASSKEREEASEAKLRVPDKEAGERKSSVPGVIAMDAERIRAAGITTEVAQAGASATEIIAQGQVEATPQGQAVLAASAQGAVTRILARIGDPVRAGQTLALIESRDAAAIAAEGASARAKLIVAQQSYTRERRLFDAKITARQDLEGAQAGLAEAEAEAQRTTSAALAAHVTRDGRSIAVVSPIMGRVTAAPAVLGAYVSAGTELFRVADPSRLQIEAAVPAADVGRIRPGEHAIVETGDGDAARAVVRFTAPGLDPQSRAASVVLAQTGGPALRPGQAVRVLIATAGPGATDVISLPEEAVQSIDGRDVVFVHTAAGFQAMPVEVGVRSAGRVEVRSGLRADQVVATQGAFALKSEAGKVVGDQD